MAVVRFLIRWWTAFAAAASVAMLAVAFAFQYLGGLAPCHLCLQQRWVYVFAIAIALPATLWALFFRSRGTPKISALLLTGVFATGTLIAAYHAGVELKWWAGPSTCTSGPLGAFHDYSTRINAIMQGGRAAVVMCDVAPWRLFGVSMAGWNAVGSAVLTLISLIASIRRKAALKPGVGEVVGEPVL